MIITSKKQASIWLFFFIKKITFNWSGLFLRHLLKFAQIMLIFHFFVATLVQKWKKKIQKKFSWEVKAVSWGKGHFCMHLIIIIIIITTMNLRKTNTVQCKNQALSLVACVMIPQASKSSLTGTSTNSLRQVAYFLLSWQSL